MFTVKDEISGELYYVVGRRLINKDTPIIDGGTPRSPALVLYQKFGFTESNKYTRYILTVCSFACPDGLDLDKYFSELENDCPDVPAMQVLRDMLYDPNSELIEAIKDKYLLDKDITIEIPKIVNSVSIDSNFWIGGIVLEDKKYLRIGTSVFRTDKPEVFMPEAGVYKALKKYVNLSKYNKETISEGDCLCRLTSALPAEAVTVQLIHNYIQHVISVIDDIKEYMPTYTFEMFEHLRNRELELRYESDIVTKKLPPAMIAIMSMFGFRPRSAFESYITSQLNNLDEPNKKNVSLTMFYNGILSSNELNTCRKEFLINVCLGPIIQGGVLPKPFKNVDRRSGTVDGVKYINASKMLTAADLDTLSTYHTGLTRRLSYQGLVTFLFDKKLASKYPDDYAQIMSEIRKMSTVLITPDLDDVYSLLNLGVNPIPLNRPNEDVPDILSKEKNWTYAHACICQFLRNGGMLDLSEHESKMQLDRDAYMLVQMIIGRSTLITDFRLYRWLVCLVHKYVYPMARGETPEGCVQVWQNHLRRKMPAAEELLFWLHRYKEEPPLLFDRFGKDTDEFIII